MQYLVSMMVFQSPEPRSIHDVSLWPDTPIRGPVEQVMEKLEAQKHRRFIKAHLPLDGLALYDEVKYIYVARDGRDACASWHNHQMAYTPGALAVLDAVGMNDETLGRPFPRVSSDLRVFFKEWIDSSPQSPGVDFFDFQTASWSERLRPNVLLVHYNDLKDDLDGEMRRIAGFLDITVPDALWPALVEAGHFSAMRREGGKLLPSAGNQFEGGAERFLYKGTNGRWRDVLSEDDLALYDAKVREKFTPGLAAWIEHGRRMTGEPRASVG
jgi:aryl sulfotransferase